MHHLVSTAHHSQLVYKVAANTVSGFVPGFVLQTAPEQLFGLRPCVTSRLLAAIELSFVGATQSDLHLLNYCGKFPNLKMAEFRKWTLHFEDGNNSVDGKRVQDPPGFTGAGGKELVSLYNKLPPQRPQRLLLGVRVAPVTAQVIAGSTKSLNMDVALLKQRRQEVRSAHLQCCEV